MKKRALTFLIIILALTWAAYFLAGRRVSEVLGEKYSAAILHAVQNKISDPVLFLQNRLWEALWLLTLAVVCVLAYSLKKVSPGSEPPGWLAQGIIGFLLLNFWLAAAQQTVLFWSLLTAGSGVQNLSQFEIKRILSVEVPPTTKKVVLVGSSVTRAQINEDLMNKDLPAGFWTFELHFPGADAYATLLTARKLRNAHPRAFVCYLNETYLYRGEVSESIAAVLELRDLGDAWSRGALRFLPAKNLVATVIGGILPVFRIREALAQRFFGRTLVSLGADAYEAGLSKNLDERAESLASSYKASAVSEFEKEALTDLARMCFEDGCSVVLVAGSLSPILASKIDPAVRVEMTQFLEALEKKYSPAVIVVRSDLPLQLAADYDDLSHVNRETQAVFTKFLEGALMSRFGEAAQRSISFQPP